MTKTEIEANKKAIDYAIEKLRLKHCTQEQYAEVEIDFARGLMSAIQSVADQIKPKWIPVTQRLPGENEIVFCFHKQSAPSDQYFVGYIDDTIWYDTAGDDRPVSYWMPLIEAPKK